MTDPTTALADGLREQYAAAIRQAAYSCDGHCGMDERQCIAAHPVQVAAWGHGVVSDVYGPPEAIADAVLAVRDDELARLRALVKAQRHVIERMTRESLAAATPAPNQRRYRKEVTP